MYIYPEKFALLQRYNEPKSINNKITLLYRKVKVKYSDESFEDRFQYFSECGSWQFSLDENIELKLIIL